MAFIRGRVRYRIGAGDQREVSLNRHLTTDNTDGTDIQISAPRAPIPVERYCRSDYCFAQFFVDLLVHFLALIGSIVFTDNTDGDKYPCHLCYQWLICAALSAVKTANCILRTVVKKAR